MQFKTLTLAAAIAVASVSAQFAQDTCTECVYASFGNDTACAAMPAADMQALSMAFQPGSVNATIIITEIKKATTKACLCSWSKDTFSAEGGARECLKGEAPVCNASQIADGQPQLDSMKLILSCDSAPSTPSTPSGSGAPPTPTGGDAPDSAAGSLSINMPYVISAAVLGLAALAGL